MKPSPFLLRPAGLIGRAFARAHATALELVEDPVGNLLVGNVALQRWLARLASHAEPLAETGLAEACADHALRAMAAGLPESSARGEFPKFTALRSLEGTAQKVIVKFSGSDRSPGSRRWSDLLVCEHLAAQVLGRELGIPAAQTRILEAADRTFREVTRFDRQGAHCRSAVCSWEAINYAWFGLGGLPWPTGTAQLLARNLIAPDTARTIAQLWHFGKPIGNSDMHDGNLGFRPHRFTANPASRWLRPATCCRCCTRRVAAWNCPAWSSGRRCRRSAYRPGNPRDLRCQSRATAGGDPPRGLKVVFPGGFRAGLSQRLRPHALGAELVQQCSWTWRDQGMHVIEPRTAGGYHVGAPCPRIAWLMSALALGLAPPAIANGGAPGVSASTKDVAQTYGALRALLGKSRGELTGAAGPVRDGEFVCAHPEPIRALT